jgi:hypothetical protein
MWSAVETFLLALFIILKLIALDQLKRALLRYELLKLSHVDKMQSYVQINTWILWSGLHKTTPPPPLHRRKHSQPKWARDATAFNR